MVNFLWNLHDVTSLEVAEFRDLLPGQSIGNQIKAGYGTLFNDQSRKSWNSKMQRLSFMINTALNVKNITWKAFSLKIG